MTDRLDSSPVLKEVLGDSLEKLQMFHDMLEKEGEIRGLISPNDIDIIWERHILNSAAVVPFILKSAAGRASGSFNRSTVFCFISEVLSVSFVLYML